MGRPKGSWTGENNPRWKGGRYKAASGYVFIKMPEHPNADKRGYVREAALIMSKHLDRPIEKDEVVHHINGIRDDNRIENLIVLKRSVHHSHHHKGLIKPNSIKNLTYRWTSEKMKELWNTQFAHRRSKPKTCDFCGKEFYRRGKPKGKRTYCSYRCSNKSNKNIQKFNLKDH